MNLELQIQEDIKAAMKAKDTVAMNAVRAIKGEILLFKTSEGGAKEVSDGDILKMIQKLVKQRKEAADASRFMDYDQALCYFRALVAKGKEIRNSRYQPH